MAWDLIADAFRGEGFVVTMPQRLADERMLEGTDPVLIAARGPARLTIHARVYSQAALELVEPVEPERYAAAMREAVDEGIRRGVKTQGVLSFANERATWR